jgi:hypothetical protein
MGMFLILIVMAVIFGILGSWIAGQRGRTNTEGFVLSALFGPLGVLVECLLPAGQPGSPPQQTAKPPSRSQPPPLPSNLDQLRQREKRLAQRQWCERNRVWMLGAILVGLCLPVAVVCGIALLMSAIQ